MSKEKDKRIQELEEITRQLMRVAEKHAPILYSKAYRILNKGREKWDGIKI